MRQFYTDNINRTIDRAPTWSWSHTGEVIYVACDARHLLYLSCAGVQPLLEASVQRRVVQGRSEMARTGGRPAAFLSNSLLRA